MKHLKSYNFKQRFESIIQDVDDIFQELRDDGYNISVLPFLPLDHENPCIGIEITKNHKFFIINPILADVQRLLDFMQLKKFQTEISANMNPIVIKTLGIDVNRGGKGIRYVNINDFVNKFDIDPRILDKRISTLEIVCHMKPLKTNEGLNWKRINPFLKKNDVPPIKTTTHQINIESKQQQIEDCLRELMDISNCEISTFFKNCKNTCLVYKFKLNSVMVKEQFNDLLLEIRVKISNIDKKIKEYHTSEAEGGSGNATIVTGINFVFSYSELKQRQVLRILYPNSYGGTSFDRSAF